MSETPRTPAGVPPVLQVAAGKDCLGERRGLGISSIAFKLSARNSSSLFVLENTFRAKGGFLMFVPGDSGGGFVGEGMFYAGAHQLIGAGALAVALPAWCLAFLVVRPLLPAVTISNAVIAMVGSGVVAFPFLILFFRGKNLIHLEIFALLRAVLLPFLWGSTLWLSGRNRGPRVS